MAFCPNYMKKYYQDNIFDLVKNNSLFTEEYSSIFNQFIFLYLFDKIITYIEDLGDELSSSSVEANILFLTLEEQDRLEQQARLEREEQERQARQRGFRIQRQEEVYRMAEANRAFSHYRW